MSSSEAASNRTRPSGRGIEWQVDFEVLKGDPRTLGYLTTECRNHAIIGAMFACGAAETAALQETIGRRVNIDEEP